MKNRVNPRISAGYGSLVSARTHREVHVSQDAMDVDVSNLGLFTKKDTLTPQSKCLLTAALNADPTYAKVTRADRSRVINEVNAFKRANINATQSDFSRLKGSEWLTDNIIAMFLQVSVQDVMPSTHCYTSHFFSNALSKSSDNVIYDYSNVVGWSDHIDGGRVGNHISCL